MYLLLDIGGTNTRIAVSEDGQTLSQSKIIPTQQDFEQALQKITQVGLELINNKKITSCAGGVAGAFDLEKTTLVKSPHLTQWVQKPLKQELENAFDAPVFLENDAHLGGLGEACFGAGKGFNIVAFVTIGTGVGGVRIVNQKIDHNKQGFEVGHQIIMPDGKLCDCGGKGHLETYVSGAYLKEPINWDEVTRYLAIGLNNTIVHWSPEVVILSGSVAQKINLETLEKYLRQFLTIFPNHPPLVKGIKEEEAGLYGALQLLKKW